MPFCLLTHTLWVGIWAVFKTFHFATGAGQVIVLYWGQVL